MHHCVMPGKQRESLLKERNAKNRKMSIFSQNCVQTKRSHLGKDLVHSVHDSKHVSKHDAHTEVELKWGHKKIYELFYELSVEYRAQTSSLLSNSNIYASFVGFRT